MPHKKSYFIPALFWHDLRRFLPIWGSMTLGMLLLPFAIWMQFCDYQQNLIIFGDVYSTSALEFPIQVHEFILGLLADGMPVVMMLYAVVPAMALLSHLYQSRSALGTHALPLTRTALFWTHYAAGLAMALIPLLISTAVTLPILLYADAFWVRTLPMFVVLSMAMYLFFFSFAMFCGMLTGQLWGLPIFYVIFNGIVWLTSAMFDAIASQYLFGYWGYLLDTTFVRFLTPIWAILDALYVSSVRADAQFIIEGLPTLFCYTLVGVAFALLTVWLFAKRQLERAGEIVTVRVLRPLFVACVGVYAGFCLMLFCQTVFAFESAVALFVLLAVGVLVGTITSVMLVEKSVAVFNRHTTKQCGAVLALGFALFGMIYFDFLGYEDYVPTVDDIESVSVSMRLYADHAQLDYDMVYPAQNKAEITLLQQAHQAFVDDYFASDTQYTAKEYDESSSAFLIEGNEATLETPDASAYTYGYTSTRMTLYYTLKNGREVTRRYRMDVNEEELARENSPVGYLESFAQTIDPVALLTERRAQLWASAYLELDHQNVSGDPNTAFALGMIDATIADFTAQGTQTSLLKKHYVMPEIGSLSLYMGDYGDADYFYLGAAARPESVSEQYLLEAVG